MLLGVPGTSESCCWRHGKTLGVHTISNQGIFPMTCRNTGGSVLAKPLELFSKWNWDVTIQQVWKWPAEKGFPQEYLPHLPKDRNLSLIWSTDLSIHQFIYVCLSFLFGAYIYIYIISIYIYLYISIYYILYYIINIYIYIISIILYIYIYLSIYYNCTYISCIYPSLQLSSPRLITPGHIQGIENLQELVFGLHFSAVVTPCTSQSSGAFLWGLYRQKPTETLQMVCENLNDFRRWFWGWFIDVYWCWLMFISWVYHNYHRFPARMRQKASCALASERIWSSCPGCPGCPPELRPRPRAGFKIKGYLHSFSKATRSSSCHSYWKWP